MPKSIPVSLRISQVDAAFISGLEVNGAVTPSEKIRSIIQEARQIKQTGSAPERLMSDMQTHMQALQKQLSTTERREKTHSEFIRFVLDWQNQFAQSIVDQEFDDTSSKADLTEFESVLAAQAFQLIDYIARLGVTPTAPCYNSGVIREKLKENMDLLHLVETQVTKGKKNG